MGALFNRARQAGAAAGTAADLPGQPPRAFQGTGHTLGGGPVPVRRRGGGGWGGEEVRERGGGLEEEVGARGGGGRGG